MSVTIQSNGPEIGKDKTRITEAFRKYKKKHPIGSVVTKIEFEVVLKERGKARLKADAQKNGDKYTVTVKSIQIKGKQD